MHIKNVTVRNTAFFLLGAASCAAIWLAGLPGLPPDGVKCAAISAMVIIWWASGALPAGYSAMALLAGYALFLDPDVVPQSLIFRMWASPNICLLIGGYLIAAAVEQSGLGSRLALLFVRRFVKSYASVIVGCYALHALLSLIIPHPWPRSFLILSVMKPLIKNSGLESRYSSNVSLAVFAASVPTSFIFLSGDCALNPMISLISGLPVSYLQWLSYMGPVASMATVLTCALQLMLFGRPTSFSAGEPEKKGDITPREKKVLALIIAAILLWLTDGFTGIHPGWVALLCACALSLPFVGALDNSSFKSVPLNSLLFLSAASAIGSVGSATGIDAWLASTLLPGGSQLSFAGFAAAAIAFCVVVHMLLGSTLTSVGVCGPAIVAFGAAAGVSPLLCALLAFCSITMHWILPHHQLSMLVGMGEGDAGYTSAQVAKMGAFQTLVALAVCCAGLAWWRLLGL